MHNSTRRETAGQNSHTTCMLCIASERQAGFCRNGQRPQQQKRNSDAEAEQQKRNLTSKPAAIFSRIIHRARSLDFAMPPPSPLFLWARPAISSFEFDLPWSARASRFGLPHPHPHPPDRGGLTLFHPTTLRGGMWEAPPLLPTSRRGGRGRASPPVLITTRWGGLAGSPPLHPMLREGVGRGRGWAVAAVRITTDFGWAYP